MPLTNRSQLKRVEQYDGNAKRPLVNQLSGTDATVSQAFWTGQLAITTAGTPEALPDKAINPGVVVLLKARTKNTSVAMSIGTSSVSAVFASTQSFKIENGESVKLRVDNLNRIFVDATVSDDILEVMLV